MRAYLRILQPPLVSLIAHRPSLIKEQEHEDNNIIVVLSYICTMTSVKQLTYTSETGILFCETMKCELSCGHRPQVTQGKLNKGFPTSPM